MKRSKKQKIDNPEFSDCIGKRTILELVWYDWKKTLPKHGQDIYIVVRLKDGFYPVMGYYLDEVLPANGPFKSSRWQTVKFHDMIPPVILGGANEEILVAWAAAKQVGEMT